MRSVNSGSACSKGAILWTCALPIVVFMILASNCYATMIVDSFDIGPQFVMVVPSGSSTSWGFSSGMSTSEVLGGSRDMLMEAISGSSISFATVDLFGDTNQLSFNEGTGTQAKLSLIWDGDTTPGLNAYALGANLTAGGCDRFVADLATIDLPILFRMEVYSDASNSSYSQKVISGGASGPQYFDFAGFSTLSGKGASFSNVGAIKFIINGTGYSATDLSLNYIATAVPEPTTSVLLFSCLLGLGICWRKKVF